jgi:curved DNA-binding protein CbpA
MRKFSTEFNYYTILGVSETSHRSEIKKAFRTLSKTHHPDKGGKEEHFKKLQEAYVVLLDENTRDHYDAYISQYKEKYDSTTIQVPVWYEPNPHLQSEADEDPDIGELGLWPDADYFQDIIDSDEDRPKTLGWYKREEQRRAKSEDGKTEYERQQEEFEKMRQEYAQNMSNLDIRLKRERDEEVARMKREEEYEQQKAKEQEAEALKLSENAIAERMYKERLEKQSFIKEKERREKGERTIFGKIKDKFDEMMTNE